MKEIYHVKICRWTPDDYVVVKTFECKRLFSAKFLKWWYELLGWKHVFIE